MSTKKFKFTNETKNFDGITLHRITATEDIPARGVQKGELGGWIEKESNLAGDAWVSDNARVYGNAWVSDNAQVCGDARVYGDAWVYGNAWVSDNAQVCGDAWVYGNAQVCGDAQVNSIRDYIVFKNWWSSGRYFTWTRSNNMWCVGCFYGTGEELITKAYKDSDQSGREYERVVHYVESILAKNDQK